MANKRGRPAAPPSEQEAEFKSAMEEWERTGSQSCWNIIWNRVFECCKAISLSVCHRNGITHNPMLSERAMDATIMVMNDIKFKGVRPEKLSSYCYLRVLNKILGKQAQAEDQEIPLSFLKDERYYYNDKETEDE